MAGLGACRQRDDGRIDSQQLTRCIEMLRGFILRRFICGDSSRGYGQMFVRALARDEGDPAAALEAYLLERGWPDDRRFVESFVLFPLYKRGYAREVLETLEPYPLHVRSVPGFMDLASGKVKVEDIQEVDIADLLGRDAVPPQQALFEKCIRGKVVMVTGAGGSIGSELCRQILSSKPKALLLFEHSEFNLYSIHLELERLIERSSLSTRLVPILGSIRNEDRLLDVMRTWEVETIYHAAAYKHVPMVEHNIAEGVMNNVIGTLNCAQAAIQAGVAHFVLISTDKAVDPVNVLGATKRLAEMVCQDLAGSDSTHFVTVRFGNVLDSAGSVVPLFREQIRRGGPVTVTDPDVTRYFMTIPEACQLIMQSVAIGSQQAVYTLDMGEPVSIRLLAEQMIRLAGKQPERDIAIIYSGLRPGEKLHETLFHADERYRPTVHPKILQAEARPVHGERLAAALARLTDGVARYDLELIGTALRDAVPEFAPMEASPVRETGATIVAFPPRHARLS